MIPRVEITRSTVRPTLVYCHCVTYWPLEDGPTCPMEHDTPIYAPLPRGRKRRVWICEKGEDSIAYLSRKAFLAHNEEDCYAQF